MPQCGGWVHIARMEKWQTLIVRRDRLVNEIAAIRRKIADVDAELEKNPPPSDVCVAVWTRKPARKLPVIAA